MYVVCYNCFIIHLYTLKRYFLYSSSCILVYMYASWRCVYVSSCPTQALSVVLNVSHFPFVIEVACWAAKREFLKLEKWVTDKIKEHHVSSQFET